MKVVVSEAAYDAIVSIFDFIAKDDPAAARAMEDAIIDTIDSLIAFPNRGRQGEVPGTRELRVPGSPYFIIYAVHDGEVRIATVWHERRSRILGDD